MRILVVGAGIAGLSAARMLAADGHEVVVAEQVPTPRAAGAGLLLHRRAVAALAAEGFEVAGLGTPLESMAITTPTGATRGVVRDRTCFVRPELLEVLLRGSCSVADVRLGQRVSHPTTTPAPTGLSAIAERSAHVDCVVGDRLERFDVVVGADGISSPTRAAAQPGVQVLSTGQVCWRGVVAMATGTRGTEMWDGSVRVGVVPLPVAGPTSTSSPPGGPRVTATWTTSSAPGCCLLASSRRRRSCSRSLRRTVHGWS